MGPLGARSLPWLGDLKLYSIYSLPAHNRLYARPDQARIGADMGGSEAEDGWPVLGFEDCSHCGSVAFKRPASRCCECVNGSGSFPLECLGYRDVVGLFEL